MIIDYISDLHLDSWCRAYPDLLSNLSSCFEPTKTTDVCVVAGDQGNGPDWSPLVVEALQNHYDYIYVIPGNHDYYGTAVGESDYLVDDLHIFAGACLWSNFRENVGSAKFAENCISDFKYIDGMTSLEMYKHHKEARAFLEKHTHCEVWITHFPMFVQSIHPKYAGDPLNPYFVNDMEDWFLALPQRPKLCIHGHTHSSMDYMMGGTRVVSNPVGYYGENQTEPVFKAKNVEIHLGTS